MPSTCRLADESVCIGPPPSAHELPEHSRDHQPRAEVTDAQAIHPGLRLSRPRTPTSPTRSRRSGFVFIGPRAETRSA